MSRPVIRGGQPKDLPAIVRMAGHFINRSQYAQYLKFMPKAVEELARKVLEVGVVFVAEAEGGEVVGMICAFALEEPISRQTIVDELAWWVEEDYRKGSTGPRLLRCLENWALQKGLRYVKMIAPMAEPGVGDYYQRLGYVPVETYYLKRLT